VLRDRAKQLKPYFSWLGNVMVHCEMNIDLAEITQSVFATQTNTICGKFRYAAERYAEKNSTIIAKDVLLKRTDALLFKFTLSVINLEFLWRISNKIQPDHQIEGPTELFEWNNSNSILDATFLESTIVQIRAFIDFSQRLACISIGQTKPVDSTEDFYKKLKRIDSPKSKSIQILFEEVDCSWGKTIRSVREKMVHYDFIRTGHKTKPIIQGKTYEEFAQEMTNEMFFLLINLCQTLFEIEWKAGTLEEFKK
jgi:hypothetical protein